MKTSKVMGSLIIIFGLSLIVLVGCGSEEEVENTDKTTEASTSTITEHENDLFRYTIENKGSTDRTYNFTSGQRIDYELTNEKGEVVHLFSSEAVFMQVLGTETVLSGESLIYDLDLSILELESGTYTIEAWMTTAEGKKNTAKYEFDIG